MKLKLPFIASDISDAKGRDRYEELIEEKPKALASLLNLTTAMKQIFLAQGTPLDYLKEVIWDDTLAQDRFFCYCDAKLIDQVRDAASHGLFAPELGSNIFHAGATASWKQVQFGEANVQLTFHENDKQTIDGTKCIVVEPDIDYEKDIAAHTLLEVIPNTLTKGSDESRSCLCFALDCRATRGRSGICAALRDCLDQEFSEWDCSRRFLISRQSLADSFLDSFIRGLVVVSIAKIVRQALHVRNFAFEIMRVLIAVAISQPFHQTSRRIA